MVKPFNRLVTIASLIPTLAVAEPIVVYNSGVDDSGVPLSGGALDPHWRITVSADPVFPGPNAFVLLNNAPLFSGGGTPNTAISKWIGLRADGGHLFPRSNCTDGCTEADYHFETTFDLTGLNPAMSVITGQWSPDDSSVMLLNGVPVASYPYVQGVNWRVFAPFTITTGFVPGVNTLTVIVNNHFLPNSNLAANPSGLHLQISGTSQICRVPFADADGDTDVDHDDFAVFQRCYAAGGGVLLPECSCFDRFTDAPSQIDHNDLQAFISCRTGPNVPFDLQNPPAGCIP